MQYGEKTDMFQIRILKITTRPRLQNGVAKNLLWNSEKPYMNNNYTDTQTCLIWLLYKKKSSLNLKR